MPTHPTPDDAIPDDHAENGGPERVRAAVIESARRLFSEQGIHAVSVREIARDVGVSHTLVHLYFGGKEEIVRQVLAGYDELVVGWLETSASPDEAVGSAFLELAHDRQFMRVLAAALIEGYVPDRIDFGPAARIALSQRVAEGAGSDGTVDPRAISMMLVVFGIGWAVTSDWVAASFEVSEEERERIEADMAALLRSVARGRT